MSIKKFIIIFIALLPLMSAAQQSSTDSLQSVLSSSAHDTVKVKALNDLFLAYEFADMTKAEAFLQQAMALSEKAGYQKGKGQTFLHMGYLAEDVGDFTAAIKNYERSLEIRRALKDK